MVQIINRPPSTSELLGDSLGQGLREGITGALSGFQQQKQQSQTARSLGALAGFDEDEIGQLSQLPIEYQQFAVQQRAAQQKQKKSQPGQISDDQRADVQNVFNRTSELLKGGRLGYRIPFTKSGPLDPKATEERAEFNTLVSAFESTFKDMVSKGTLAKDRFAYLMSILPKASDRDRVILGKMKAIARELKLDPATLPSFDKEEASSKDAGESVRIRLPDGSIGSVPKSNVDKALERGAKLVK